MLRKITTAWTASAAVFLAACLGAAPAAHAGPASPQPVRIEQPDGTAVQAVVRGDEFQGWIETSDGYTIVKNPHSRFYEYAAQAADGRLVPSGFVVSNAVRSMIASRGLMPRKGMRPPPHEFLRKYQKDFLNANQAARRLGALAAASGPIAAPASPLVPAGTWAPVPVTGQKKILLILVNFQNSRMSFGAPAYWSNAVHGTSGASVARYYQDNAQGAVSVVPVAHTQQGSPAGVVSVWLPQMHPDYGNNFSYPVESSWVNSALAAAAPYVNFPGLDTNGDGTIAVDEALMYFVVAGYEASAGYGGPSIWAHAWGGPGVGVSGKNVDHWALNGEMFSATSRVQMGVIAHEMGHAMGGLPDLYDTSGNNAGLGIFSLMANGGWGARTGEALGTTPVNLDAWSRHYLGWSSPQVASANGAVTFASPLASRSAALMLMNGASSRSEYWLVENRPPVGWDAGMQAYLGPWAGGLLVQHIDLNIGSKIENSFNQFTPGSHQGNMAEEPSTADCSLLRGSLGCPKMLFYAGNSTAFNAGSVPASTYHSGKASGLGISGVSAPGNTMTAMVQVATSAQVQYMLFAGTAGKGGGTLASSPAGIACPGACSAAYGAGTNVTLRATPAPGAMFAGWSGACSGTNACVVSMTAARSVVANFKKH